MQMRQVQQKLREQVTKVIENLSLPIRTKIALEHYTSKRRMGFLFEALNKIGMEGTGFEVRPHTNMLQIVIYCTGEPLGQVYMPTYHFSYDTSLYQRGEGVKLSVSQYLKAGTQLVREFILEEQDTRVYVFLQMQSDGLHYYLYYENVPNWYAVGVYVSKLLSERMAKTAIPNLKAKVTGYTGRGQDGTIFMTVGVSDYSPVLPEAYNPLMLKFLTQGISIKSFKRTTGVLSYTCTSVSEYPHITLVVGQHDERK